MSKITIDVLLTSVKAKFDSDITNISEPFGLLTLETSREKIIDLLTFLKTDAALQFIYLTDITAIHYPETEKPIGVIYHLHSLANYIRVRIKVFMADDDLKKLTATVLWNGANWMERETYDFFGVVFEGHPDLRRILNVDDMTVFPMRR